jgi:chemotaxis protein methyltransferase CheR
MVTFRQFNLLDPYDWLDDLDVVFFRIVLIYFDKKSKAAVIEKISEILRPNGALLLGHAESVNGLARRPQIFRSDDRYTVPLTE